MGLSVEYLGLLRETGLYLGYSRDRVYTTNQERDLDDILKKAMRQWYFPAVGDGIYQWSFLRKSGLLPLVASTATYALPEDFIGLITPCFYYASGANQTKVSRESEHTIMGLYGSDQTDGNPRYFATRPSNITQEGRSQYEVLFYPVPNAVVTLSYRYAFIPPPLDYDNPYPLGGDIHGEAILEACLAMAEQRMEDTEGLHTKRFTELLAASIRMDQDLAA